MTRKSKLFLAMLLALAICFANILTALAAGLDENGALIATDEDNPPKAAITKILQMPAGAIVPDVTFNFIAAKISVDEDTSDTAKDTMPPLNSGNLTVSYESDKDTGPVVTKETGDIFDGVVFQHAGIYVYEITEEPNTNSDIDNIENIHETLTYSGAKYTITVYVSNTEDDSGTYIRAIGTKITTKDTTDQSAGTKVDPTPGGDNEHYFKSQMVFTNTYLKTNGAVDPENPDPATESTLLVSKTVTGDLGNERMFFNFSITLTVPDLLSPVPEYYKAYVVEKIANVDTVVTSTDNADISLIGTDSTDNGYKYIMVSTVRDQATAFNLKDGQRLVFVNTPIGTGYTVSEIDPVGHVPSYVITTDGIAASKVTGSTGVTLTASKQIVGERANQADFTNFRDWISPTGLSMNDLPFVGLIILAAGALIVFIAAKSRKREADNK